MGENNSKWNNWQSINFQNIQAAQTTQYQKNKPHNQKVGKRPKQTFLQRRHTDGQQTHERCSTLLIIWEMQIKTTMRYHLTLVKDKKNLQSIKAGEGIKKGILPHVSGNVNWYNHYGKQDGGSIWPSKPTTGHMTWENHNSKRHMYPNVHCSTIYNNQDMDTT